MLRGEKASYGSYFSMNPAVCKSEPSNSFPAASIPPFGPSVSVGSDPPFLVRGEGAHVWDADGNRYIDYVGSWGPLILGHADPEVIEAIIQAARNGTSFGASTPTEAELARW